MNRVRSQLKESFCRASPITPVKMKHRRVKYRVWIIGLSGFSASYVFLCGAQILQVLVQRCPRAKKTRVVSKACKAVFDGAECGVDLMNCELCSCLKLKEQGFCQ